MTDLNKEREAFEADQNTTLLFERIEYIAAMNAYMPKFEYANNLIVMQAAERFNFGWSMWQKAKAQAVPEGFKIVPIELSEEIAERLALERVQKPRPENDPVWVEIAERAYKSNLLAKKWELVREYKILTEASESGAEG
ncbi:hypothetical protein [Acinetobacter baumannii]|uniref:hypothetical protein n=1 Tax=Acinetobacter baumannii TaxID=470 RepID=UPI003AFA2D51